MWNITTSSSTNYSTLTMALNTTDTSGYVAVAWPSTAGQMAGASSMILKACSSCSSGAAMEQYYLSGTAQSNVKPGGALSVRQASFIAYS